MQVKAAKCALTSTPVMETSKNHPAKLHVIKIVVFSLIYLDHSAIFIIIFFD